MELAAAESWARRLHGVAWLRGLRSVAAGVAATASDRRLFVVGGAEEPPWHLTAHLQLLHQAGRLPGGVPVLATAEQVTAAGAGDGVLGVSERELDDDLLERIEHARRQGAAVFGVSGTCDADLAGLSREFVAIEPAQRVVAGGLVAISFETATHLLPVSATPAQRRIRRPWPGAMLRRSSAAAVGDRAAGV